jgi:hypothetical protein
MILFVTLKKTYFFLFYEDSQAMISDNKEYEINTQPLLSKI